jgi:hypothetical protein
MTVQGNAFHAVAVIPAIGVRTGTDAIFGIPDDFMPPVGGGYTLILRICFLCVLKKTLSGAVRIMGVNNTVGCSIGLDLIVHVVAAILRKAVLHLRVQVAQPVRETVVVTVKGNAKDAVVVVSAAGSGAGAIKLVGVADDAVPLLSQGKPLLFVHIFPCYTGGVQFRQMLIICFSHIKHLIKFMFYFQHKHKQSLSAVSIVIMLKT